MRQGIVLALDRVERVGSGQTDPTLTLRSNDTAEHRPGSRRRIESGRGLGAAEGHLSLASLQIGSVETRIAFPEVGCLAPVVSWRERMLVLPDTAYSKVILKIPPHTRKMLHDRQSEAL